MTVYWEGDFASYIGQWNGGTHHGYGKRFYANGEIQEGLIENDIMKSDWKSIRSYNPESNPIASKIDFEKFLKRSSFKILSDFPTFQEFDDYVDE